MPNPVYPDDNWDVEHHIRGGQAVGTPPASGMTFPGRIVSYTGAGGIWNVRRYFDLPISNVAGDYETITARSVEGYVTGFVAVTYITLFPVDYDTDATIEWAFSFPGWA